MRSLTTRTLRIWLLCALALSSTWMLFWFDPDLSSSRSFGDAWNLGHIFYFALLSYLLLQTSLIARQSAGTQWMIILGLAFLAGGLIELSQIGTNRTADVDDLWRDLIGSLLVLAFTTVSSRTRAMGWGLLGVKIGVFLLLLVYLKPFTLSLLDEAIARARFPVLADFQTPFELTRWTGDALDSIQSPGVDGAALLRLRLTPRRYSGAYLEYFPGDWRRYQFLRIELYNPGPKVLKVTCRIHDAQHLKGPQLYTDRFNQTYLLQPGMNKIVIDLKKVEEAPDKRSMNMAEIRGLGIFTTSLESSRTLYIGEISLRRVRAEFVKQL